MQEKIIQLLDEERTEDLHALLDSIPLEELAKIMESLDSDRLTALFDCLDKETAADVFVLLNSETQKRVLKDFSDVKLQSVTDEILDDDVEELLGSMPQDVVHEVLLKATPENRNDKIVEIVDYLEEKKFSLKASSRRTRACRSCGDLCGAGRKRPPHRLPSVAQRARGGSVCRDEQCSAGTAHPLFFG